MSPPKSAVDLSLFSPATLRFPGSVGPCQHEIPATWVPYHPDASRLSPWTRLRPYRCDSATSGPNRSERSETSHVRFLTRRRAGPTQTRPSPTNGVRQDRNRVSPTFRNCPKKCRPGTGTTVSTMNRRSTWDPLDKCGPTDERRLPRAIFVWHLSWPVKWGGCGSNPRPRDYESPSRGPSRGAQ